MYKKSLKRYGSIFEPVDYTRLYSQYTSPLITFLQY